MRPIPVLFPVRPAAPGAYPWLYTQFKAQPLIQHLEDGWQLPSGALRDRFITPVPAQMRTGDDWYRGTADAVYQNLNLIRRARPRHVAVFGADHIYRMDIRQMVQEHIDCGADVSMAALPVKIETASQFGVMEVDPRGRIERFVEKPCHPKPLPGERYYAFASMGNYLFNTDVLLDTLPADADATVGAHRPPVPGTAQAESRGPASRLRDTVLTTWRVTIPRTASAQDSLYSR